MQLVFKQFLFQNTCFKESKAHFMMSHCTKRYRSEEISPWGEGEFWKKHKGVLFQCPTLKIGRHFLYWHPNLSIQLKCTVNFKSRRILAERRFLEDFFWTVFFFRKQDWQTLKAKNQRVSFWWESLFRIDSKGDFFLKIWGVFIGMNILHKVILYTPGAG